MALLGTASDLEATSRNGTPVKTPVSGPSAASTTLTARLEAVGQARRAAARR